jgi:NAD-dependent deacetylase
MEHTEDFYSFYKDKMIYREAEPNIVHKKLAQLEEQGKLTAVITQNIDGLHQKAGSNKVYELHGSVQRNYCMDCGKFHGLPEILKEVGIPRCNCGGIIKPDVVLYEEGLDERTMSDAVKLITHSDLFIIGGTSLNVYPAAGLIRYYRGSRMVLINKSDTSYDREADLLIQAGLGQVFSKL